MDRHTPGPWRIYREDDGGHECTSIGTDYDHPQLGAPAPVVGLCYGPRMDAAGNFVQPVDPVVTIAIRPADADLIATAPEMLEMLREARDWCESIDGFDFTRLDDLIAKAEGRSAPGGKR